MDKLPLPTDNIYKFYALFGLLMFVFSIGAMLVQNRATNTRIYELTLQIEAAQPLEAGKPSIKEQMLQKLLEVEKSDKKFISGGLVGLCVAGFYLMLYGFRKWHKDVQPLQDEMFQLQLEKLRREAA